MKSASASIRALIADAQNQTSVIAHTPVGYTEPTAYLKKAPASTGTLNLNSSLLPGMMAKDGQMYGDPIATPGGESITMAAGILQNSRCAAAGATIITRPDPTRALAVGRDKGIAFQRVAKYFSTIEAAPFATVAEDAEGNDTEVGVSDLPISRATLNWAESVQKSVRFELPRSLQRQVGYDQIVDEVMLAFVFGLARASDAVLLEAILASTPATFTPSAVATKGLRINELRALVGRDGDGAGWRGDGQFAAAGGILADTTADAAGTVIGSFGRAGVAIHESIDLIIERRNLQGDLVLTAHANMIPMLPNPGVFWTP